MIGVISVVNVLLIFLYLRSLDDSAIAHIDPAALHGLYIKFAIVSRANCSTPRKQHALTHAPFNCIRRWSSTSPSSRRSRSPAGGRCATRMASSQSCTDPKR